MSSPTTATVEHGPPPGSVEAAQQRLAAAFRRQYSVDGYIVGTYPDYVIVSIWRNDGLDEYRRYDYTVDGDTITFSDPVPLEIQYVPADAIAEAGRRRAQESSRRNVADVRELLEASYDSEANTLALTVIQAGFNTSKSRYYTEAALRDSGPQVFRGLKMYLNHATRAEEQARPEGDLRDYVAYITETAYDAPSKRIRATAKVIDPDFAAKVRMLNEADLLNTLGVSIRAIGSGLETTVEGARTFRVDEFAAARSVDFVTEPGAGGYVEWLEAAEQDDIETVTAARLRERRPDLVTALISEARQEDHMSEQELAEARRQLEEQRAAREAAETARQEAEARAAAAESALEEARAADARREAQTAITALIAESKLPEPSRKYLASSLAEESDIEKAKAAIEAQRTLVAELAPGGHVKGLGDGGSSESGNADVAGAFAAFLGSEESGKLAATRGR